MLALYAMIASMHTLWFLMALGGSLSAHYYFGPRGMGREAYYALHAGAIGSCMLVVVYLGQMALGFMNPMTLLMAGLWGFFAWRDLKQLGYL